MMTSKNNATHSIMVTKLHDKQWITVLVIKEEALGKEGD